MKIPFTGMHWLNALPVIFPGQLHIGIWLMTLHRALAAQAPIHGFIHLFLEQAWSLGQSEFKTHSGRHSRYGLPWKSDRQVQVPLEHSAFGPHGDGLHKSAGIIGVAKELREIRVIILFFNFRWYVNFV